LTDTDRFGTFSGRWPELNESERWKLGDVGDVVKWSWPWS
jgi:hypothetical protein